MTNEEPTNKTPMMGKCTQCGKEYDMRSGAYKNGMICTECYSKSNEQQLSEWEKKFDERFSHEDDCRIRSSPNHSWSCNCEKGEYKDFIRSLLGSHHAHLKEKVEGMKIIENAANFSIAIVNGERGEALMEAHNKALDKVLALLD